MNENVQAVKTVRIMYAAEILDRRRQRSARTVDRDGDTMTVDREMAAR
jgi:hypothetical protein